MSVKRLFQHQGYTVLTHARLNVAWSRVISDIDVIAVSNEKIIMVEVKSDHDYFYKGFKQLEKLKGFADELYIATNRQIIDFKGDKWRDPSIGLIRITDDLTEIVRPAVPIHGLCTGEAISLLKKKCLVRLASLLNIPKCLPKQEMERRLRENFDNADLKEIVKSLILCDNACDVSCSLEPFLIASCSNVKRAQK